MKILNLDCAAKSNLYPGVREAVDKALDYHNPDSPSFLGRAGKSFMFKALDRIATAWNTNVENLYFSDRASSITKLLHTAGIRWNCYNIEHKSNRDLASMVVDYSVPWDSAISDKPGYWLQSRYNHETGLSLKKPFVKNIILDATSMEPRKIDANKLFFSGSKSGSLPLGVLVSTEQMFIGSCNNLPALAGLAAAYDWISRSEVDFVGIKKTFMSLKELGWDIVDSGVDGSDRILTVIATYPSDLYIGEGELFGLALSGGSACSSGSPVKNNTVDILLGEDKAKRALRLSWDRTWTVADAQDAVERLKKLHLHCGG